MACEKLFYKDVCATIYLSLNLILNLFIKKTHFGLLFIILKCIIQYSLFCYSLKIELFFTLGPHYSITLYCLLFIL